ncbi:MAG: Kdo hydroxylase family protein [Gammaproteobacteria bacterium]
MNDWREPCPGSMQAAALSALEDGSVLFFPQLGFGLSDQEAGFLTPTTGSKRKNISLDLCGTLIGTALKDREAESLKAMMQRFAECTRALLLNLFPRFSDRVEMARTSFRPVEIIGRSTSWRKDDTRLHVDSFPSMPVHGNRILRVFSNINPSGQPRAWRIGEPFERVASRFLPSLAAPAWGSSELLRFLRVTKIRRSPYDHFMLQLHDQMKADFEYQSSANQILFNFPPGSSWIVFTDQVSHAAMAGQYLLEQTFYLPVASMADPAKSPLRILERLTGRKLVG